MVNYFRKQTPAEITAYYSWWGTAINGPYKKDNREMGDLYRNGVRYWHEESNVAFFRLAASRDRPNQNDTWLELRKVLDKDLVEVGTAYIYKTPTGEAYRLSPVDVCAETFGGTDCYKVAVHQGIPNPFYTHTMGIVHAQVSKQDMLYLKRPRSGDHSEGFDYTSKESKMQITTENLKKLDAKPWDTFYLETPENCDFRTKDFEAFFEQFTVANGAKLFILPPGMKLEKEVYGPSPLANHYRNKGESCRFEACSTNFTPSSATKLTAKPESFNWSDIWSQESNKLFWELVDHGPKQPNPEMTWGKLLLSLTEDLRECGLAYLRKSCTDLVAQGDGVKVEYLRIPSDVPFPPSARQKDLIPFYSQYKTPDSISKENAVVQDEKLAFMIKTGALTRREIREWLDKGSLPMAEMVLAKKRHLWDYKELRSAFGMDPLPTPFAERNCMAEKVLEQWDKERDRFIELTKAVQVGIGRYVEDPLEGPMPNIPAVCAATHHKVEDRTGCGVRGVLKWSEDLREVTCKMCMEAAYPAKAISWDGTVAIPKEVDGVDQTGQITTLCGFPVYKVESIEKDNAKTAPAENSPVAVLSNAKVADTSKHPAPPTFNGPPIYKAEFYGAAELWETVVEDTSPMNTAACKHEHLHMGLDRCPTCHMAIAEMDAKRLRVAFGGVPADEENIDKPEVVVSGDIHPVVAETSSCKVKEIDTTNAFAVSHGWMKTLLSAKPVCENPVTEEKEVSWRDKPPML